MSSDTDSVDSRNSVFQENTEESKDEQPTEDSSSNDPPRARHRRDSVVVRTVGTIVLLLYSVLKKLGWCKSCSETLP